MICLYKLQSNFDFEKFNDSQNAIKYCDDALNKNLPFNLKKLFDSNITKITV